jgi:UDP-MurNAc hydroxylase
MSNHKTNIEFINHASVLVRYNKTAILSDPWYYDSVFNKGWRLVYDNDKNYIKEILNKINYIYISHEHPDHFNPQFLASVEIREIIIKNKIKFIFQKTKDKRVISFLKKVGFEVIECPINKKIKLNSDTYILISKHDFYDSSILIEFPDNKILNLNDCPLRTEVEIKKFQQLVGNVDLLLTQFSYAAWKGAKNEKNLRLISANEKIKNIVDQYKYLKPKKVIPFASYIYFSNEMNFYMNDKSNKPLEVVEKLKSQNVDAVILKPGETQEIDTLKQNPASLEFWSTQLNKLENKKLDVYDKEVSLQELNEQFQIYKKKIIKKNSIIIIKFLNKIKFLNFFQDINIYLTDHNINYKFSIINGIIKTADNKKDIEMHSESLYFILKNEFGYDTLTVNGCFETSFEKFNKVTRTLALGSLNAMGINLNIFIIFRANIIILFLKKLRSFISKAKSSRLLSS